MHVLEHEHPTTLGPQGSEDGADRGEEPLTFPDAVRARIRFGPPLDLRQQPRDDVPDVRSALGECLLKRCASVSLVRGPQHLGDREQRHFGRQRQARTSSEERIIGDEVVGGDQAGLADAGLAGDQQEATARTRQMPSQLRELCRAPRDRDPRLVRGRRRPRRQPEITKPVDVARHRLDDKLQHAPRGKSRRREDPRDGRVAAPRVSREHPEARPAGPVVQAMQSIDELPMGTRRDVRPGQGAHPTTSASRRSTHLKDRRSRC